MEETARALGAVATVVGGKLVVPFAAYRPHKSKALDASVRPDDSVGFLRGYSLIPIQDSPDSSMPGLGAVPAFRGAKASDPLVVVRDPPLDSAIEFLLEELRIPSTPQSTGEPSFLKPQWKPRDAMVTIPGEAGDIERPALVLEANGSSRTKMRLLQEPLPDLGWELAAEARAALDRGEFTLPRGHPISTFARIARSGAIAILLGEGRDALPTTSDEIYQAMTPWLDATMFREDLGDRFPLGEAFLGAATSLVGGWPGGPPPEVELFSKLGLISDNFAEALPRDDLRIRIPRDVALAEDYLNSQLA